MFLEQEVSDDSVPKQLTLSSQIGPVADPNLCIYNRSDTFEVISITTANLTSYLAYSLQQNLKATVVHTNSIQQTVLFSVFDALTLVSSTFYFTFNNLDVTVIELT